MRGLVNTMSESCSFAEHTAELNDRSELFRATIRQILKQVIECAYFIRDYCQDTTSGVQDSIIVSVQFNNIPPLPPLSCPND